jgi:hypothetical protein
LPEKKKLQGKGEREREIWFSIHLGSVDFPLNFKIARNPSKSQIDKYVKDTEICSSSSSSSSSYGSRQTDRDKARKKARKS